MTITKIIAKTQNYLKTKNKKLRKFQDKEYNVHTKGRLP